MHRCITVIGVPLPLEDSSNCKVFTVPLGLQCTFIRYINIVYSIHTDLYRSLCLSVSGLEMQKRSRSVHFYRHGTVHMPDYHDFWNFMYNVGFTPRSDPVRYLCCEYSSGYLKKVQYPMIDP